MPTDEFIQFGGLPTAIGIYLGRKLATLDTGLLISSLHKLARARL